MRSFDKGSRFGGDRGNRGFGGPRGGFGGKPTMFKATCAKCGNDCEVPFRPSGTRPVFCSNCFDHQGANSDRSGGGNFRKPSFYPSASSGRGGGDRGDRQIHAAICAKCGDNCEVPFRPTEGKQVFCSKCFDRTGSPSNKSFSGGASVNPAKEQFALLNAKLDKILKALNISTAPEVKETPVKKAPVEMATVASLKADPSTFFDKAQGKSLRAGKKAKKVKIEVVKVKAVVKKAKKKK